MFSFQRAGKPGEFAFLDASTPGYGNRLTRWSWDFGDGASSNLPDPRHAYTKPGTYSVSLTVTDSGGHSDTATHSVTIEAPTLNVAISFPGAAGNAPQPNPGDSIAARVTVSASDGLGNLSNLTFAGDPLEVSPTARLSITSAPPASAFLPFTLSPVTQKSFAFQLKANTLGNVTVSSIVTGLDAAGNTVTGQDHQPFTIGHVLQVRVRATPDHLKLKNAQDGSEQPQAVAVDVAVTNNSQKTLQQVMLTCVEGVRGDTADRNIPVIQNGPPKVGALSGAEAPSYLVSLRQASQTDSCKTSKTTVGTLGPGASRTVHYPFQAQGDGNGRIDALASARNPDNARETLQGAGSTTVKVDPTAILKLDFQTPSGTADLGIVKAGEQPAVRRSVGERQQLLRRRPQSTGTPASRQRRRRTPRRHDRQLRGSGR